MTPVPTAGDLAAAHAATRSIARETPVLESDRLTRAVGAARLYVKAESLQRAGSFKLRGAYWRLCALTADERVRGVVAFSSGNFAQGLALAGRELGVPVTIVMPSDAPAMKRQATVGFGATVVLSHHGDRPREEVASDLAAAMAREQGLTLLHPFDDPLVVAGQGGVALESMAQIGAAPDVVVSPVGGGGLMGGTALAVRAANPQAAIWAAEPAGYDGMGQSLADGTRVTAKGGATICDALQATMPGAAPFAACTQAGVQGVSVTDVQVAHAMRVAFDELKLVLEPSGAVGLAAVLGGLVPVAGKVVLVMASGGNIPFARFAEIVEQAEGLQK
jgi:threonine dehydratase